MVNFKYSYIKEWILKMEKKYTVLKMIIIDYNAISVMNYVLYDFIKII